MELDRLYYKLFKQDQAINRIEKKLEFREDKKANENSNHIDKLVQENMDLKNEVKNLEDICQQSLMQIDSLKNEMEALKEAEKEREEKGTYTLAVQLLHVHYMSILSHPSFNGMSNIQIAGLLKINFNAKGDENIRKRLSNVGGKNSDLMTPKNLNQLRDIYEELGCTELADKVKMDLAKIKG